MNKIKIFGAKNHKALRHGRKTRHIRLGLWLNKRSNLFRITSFSVALVVSFGVIYEAFNARVLESNYNLSAEAATLIPNKNTRIAGSLKQKTEAGSYEFNEGFQPGGDAIGQGAKPQYSASFKMSPEKGVDITDPYSQVTVTMKPKFSLATPKQEANRLIYPIKGKNASAVYTLRTIGFKEDIILNSYKGNHQAFTYEMVLPSGTEARLEKDGSLAIYGANSALVGNVSAGTEKDAELLKKAQEKAEKNTLLFKFPAPFVKEYDKDKSDVKSWFELQGNDLTIHADGLKAAVYPLSIDPSVYIETAAKLIKGNNESNVDFDIDNELFQKSHTTGARIDAWEDNLDMTQGTWDHGTAAAGGYVYRVGGRTDPTKPSIVGQQRTLNSGTSTFTMSMPSTRPAGDLYIAMMCHDGSDGGSVSAPSGWTQIADLQGYIAYYKVGTDQGGGNESASYNWGGYGTEEWAGVIIRITGFNSSDPVSGTPGTGSSSSNANPTYPATTPDNDATLSIRGAGFDQDDPSDTGWVPTGHTKIDSESSSNGGNGSCGFTSASLDSPPLSGVSTGTAAHADGSVNDDYGASTIAINPSTTSGSVQNTVYWAQFNSSTLELESPNPGQGACSGWCTDSDYNLPEARRGHSVVAYNGFLYVIGGVDGSGNRESTVWVSKLGANGEPSLWHPTDPDQADWVYWYPDTGLSSSTARSYMGAYAYNNKMYILGGQTNASTGGTTTSEYAEIKPTGELGTWTSGTALPSARFGHGVQAYNDRIYLIGGNSSGTMQNSVHYNKLESDGSMNAWTATTSFSGARASMGGQMTALWGGYIYIGGGCSAVNGSGYCTTISTDMQLTSINADGSLAEWGTMIGLQNERVGYSFVAWQDGLYRLGGCARQNTSTGNCASTLADVDFGVINDDGDASTVSITEASGAGNCTGGSPYDCDLPPAGDDAGEIGHMLNVTAILNGYLYVIGGCTDYTCSGSTPQAADTSGNVAHVAIGSDGTMRAPSSCSGTSYGAWCVNNTNRVNGTTGTAASGVAVFNGRIYVMGGLTGSGNHGQMWSNTTDNSTGALSGNWDQQDLTNVGVSEDVSYTYAYARANPASAGTYPGNLYLFGGCGATSEVGCTGSDYETEVYKCNIETTGLLEEDNANDCDTSGQQQLDTEATSGSQGLGIHSGTVYANYIYLVGGYSQNVSDRDTIFYAKFNDSNNVVAVSGGAWVENSTTLNTGRRRGAAFGYNGYLYAVGGFDNTAGDIIDDIEFGKIDVSDGSVGAFSTSTVTINQRWGLAVSVSNSYAYVIGGCNVGDSPSGCSSFESSIQTFQLYNNDSGTVSSYGAGANLFTTDRYGTSSVVYNGYIYVAGGCTSTGSDCTDATNSVQYASLNDYGVLSSWSATSANLPADRAWGQLEVAGGTLYYIGGQPDSSTDERTEVYYGTPSSGDITTWSTASNGLPAGRTQFGAATWNDRIYVTGGLDTSAAATNTVYISPDQSGGGNITSAWTSDGDTFDVARSGNTAITYANNLYVLGGYTGSQYLSDVQMAQINSDGSVDAWTFTTNMPEAIRQADGFAVNGYMYLFGGRTATNTCVSNSLVSPISANTTIVSGNNPTGIGEWFETNQKYSGDRYGNAAAYSDGKVYILGGACGAGITLTGANRVVQSTLKSQPQIAKYSRAIDTDVDVFPTKWLLNGLDNDIGARWQMLYRSSTNSANTWGQATNFGDVTLGSPEDYNPLDTGGSNTSFARYFYLVVSIDASKTFGYPEDVERGPTVDDLTLFFQSNPAKRLRHGKTWSGGLQQPLDTPF